MELGWTLLCSKGLLGHGIGRFALKFSECRVKVSPQDCGFIDSDVRKPHASHSKVCSPPRSPAWLTATCAYG